jgi:hypothetical protein
LSQSVLLTVEPLEDPLEDLLLKLINSPSSVLRAGTRPKVLFPAKPITATETTAEEGHPSDVLTFARRRRRPKKKSPSDVPDYVRYDELPKTVCYGDVDLFVIRNPEGDRDMLAAVIDFRNLKGR